MSAGSTSKPRRKPTNPPGRKAEASIRQPSVVGRHAFRPVIVVEDDAFTRIIQIVLDPAVAPARIAAFAHFFGHELSDFDGWCVRLRQRLACIHPARIELVASQEALATALSSATAAVVESLAIGPDELARAPQLRVVQKFGTVTANIDMEACSRRQVRVLTLRRRANIACAEHTLGLMLALARKIPETNGLISAERLTAAGHAPTQYDRAHTGNSNWARVRGVRTLHGKQLGIFGLGEIGREVAARAAIFGMKILYTQRRPLPSEDERQYGATYCALDELLATSDFVSLHLPGNAATRGIIGARELNAIKPGAFLVNISRADLVDREALLAALRTGRLGGFALDPLYEAPGRDDDPLLGFRNVVITPHLAAQPRFNALEDFEELLTGLDAALNS
jgi:phosphoglycerate dehydrogenase-like enzyme